MRFAVDAFGDRERMGFIFRGSGGAGESEGVEVGDGMKKGLVGTELAELYMQTNIEPISDRPY